MLEITPTTSTARTSQQNGVVERRNRTLVEAARTMLIFSKSPLFLWAEVVATACYTQNRSLIHTVAIRTPYESASEDGNRTNYLTFFGDLCYPNNDFVDLRDNFSLKKILESSSAIHHPRKANRLYNERTKQIMETMNVQFDELTQMASKTNYGFMVPDLHGLTSEHIITRCYMKNPSAASNPISVETLPPPNIAEASSSSTSIDKDAPSTTTSPKNETLSPPINSTNVEPNEEVAEFDSDTFTNPFAPPETNLTKSSSRIVNTSNMHTFQQPSIYTKRRTKDHLLVTIIGDLSKPISTRRQLSTDALWCYFHVLLAKEESKNYKEAMEESCWTEDMQEKIHEFEQLEAW
ncbi:integrase, catalytic region, zinc finger, CCHC-type containing protein [Tanacetum coccineum]